MGDDLAGPNSILKESYTGRSAYLFYHQVTSHPFQSTYRFSIFGLPEIFRPWDDRNGWDYDKIFVEDESRHKGLANAYTTNSIG